MAIYGNNPSVYEANGDGSYTYRWNIQEVSLQGNDGESITQWQCDEIVVWGTVTSDKITESVINYLWPKGHEQKLINEYNQASLGMLNAEKAEAKIANYRNFLSNRQAIKAQIDEDCSTYNIR